MRELERAIFSATLRRSPVTLMASTEVLARRIGVLADVGPWEKNASRSSCVMRPAGPVPGTWRRSTPASRARRRTAGAAMGFSPSGRGGPCKNCCREAVGAGLLVLDTGEASARFSEPAMRGSGVSVGSVPSAAGASCGDVCSPIAVGVLPSPGALRRTRSEPTATTSPTSAPSQTISPEIGDGISTVALSVITAASVASARTRSPILTCHSTSSASATPSPTSGSLITCSAISLPHHVEQRSADADWPGEVVPFLCMRIRRIPPCDARNGRLQMIEAGFLHKRGKLRAKPRGQCRLVDDHAPARLPDRCLNGLQIKRQQCSKVDNLGIDAGFRGSRHGDMNHRSIGENRQRRSFASDGRLTKRYRIVTLGNFAELMTGPGRNRPLVVAIERSIVEPLRLQEDDRIRVLDCRNQQPLGVARIRRHDCLDAAHVGEQSLRTLAMSLSSEDSAAGRHPYDERTGKLAVGAITQSRSFGDDLVVRRVHIVGKLDLDAGPKAVGGHADCRANDTQFADWRIEAAALAIFRLQALGCTKDSPKEAHILTEHNDIVIMFHHHVYAVADGLDHGLARHG